MSHFLVYVLLPGNTPPASVEGEINSLLSPYHENMEVDEYDRDCYCIGREARNAGLACAEDKTPINFLRDSFKNTDIAKKYEAILFDKKIGRAEANRITKEHDRLWREHIAEYVRIEKESTKAHPMFNKPNSSCEECSGTGKYKSRYNPKSKWDWYRIGGRWDGVIKNSPRKSQGGFNFGAEHTLVKNNALMVSEFPNPITDDVVPFAIVTPDGEWHERGNMGWWGIVINEDNSWEEQARKILEDNRSCLAIACDLHI